MLNFPEERGIIRLGECTSEVVLVTVTGSWTLNLPSMSSSAIGVASRHVVTIRSLDEQSFVISVPVEDHPVSQTLSALQYLGSKSHPISDVKLACSHVFASLAPVFSLLDTDWKIPDENFRGPLSERAPS